MRREIRRDDKDGLPVHTGSYERIVSNVLYPRPIRNVFEHVLKSCPIMVRIDFPRMPPQMENPAFLKKSIEKRRRLEVPAPVEPEKTDEIEACHLEDAPDIRPVVVRMDGCGEREGIPTARKHEALCRPRTHEALLTHHLLVHGKESSFGIAETRDRRADPFFEDAFRT